MFSTKHEYVDRKTGELRTEELAGDRLLHWAIPEQPGLLYRMFTTRRLPSRTLAWLNFDAPLLCSAAHFAERFDIQFDECAELSDQLRTPRQIFERRIRFEDCRPLPDPPQPVVSPCDARVLVGSLAETSAIVLKEKFFSLPELLGYQAERWQETFAEGDFAVLRLTLDKYHYNHVPVSGIVSDFYSVEGHFHSCNPGAAVKIVTPCSKNRRVVTIVDTDVPGGAGVGQVAMIEVVALMIGEIVQCYSENGYESPRNLHPGLFLKQGQPKSLFRPGSSSVVLLFERGRIAFAEDIVRNMSRPGSSRFSVGFGRPLLETDITVRSFLARHAGGVSER